MIQSAMENTYLLLVNIKKKLWVSDQLDDLLAFTEFKETQTEIIREISQIIQIYIEKKSIFIINFSCY